MRFPVLLACALCALSSTGAEAHVRFRLPLAQIPPYPHYYQFYDHNRGSGLQDWMCGRWTYEQHNGTDFSTPNGWATYAGAGGQLYYRYDGCSNSGSWGSSCGGGFGNHVRIQHANGSVTIHAHLYPGSPAWYQSLGCGVQVGTTGNSGRSTTPHLHYELWSNQSASARLDFFGGPCSNGGTSYWTNQNWGYPTTACHYGFAPEEGGTTADALEPSSPTLSVANAILTFATTEGTEGVLAIYDVTGRRVRTLITGSLPVGTRTVTWDGRDDRGTALASGVYFAELSTPLGQKAAKLLLVR